MQSLQHITRHTSLSQKVSVQYFLRQKVHRRVKKIYCTEMKNKKIYIIIMQKISITYRVTEKGTAAAALEKA